MNKSLKLLPRNALVKTGPVDRANWNYTSKLAWLQRRRFHLLLSLLGNRPVDRLLELGYGSGILMPELATRCSELFGADPHPHSAQVHEVLAAHGVEATLVSAGAEQLPFTDGFFDTIVTISAIEYVTDIDRACTELRRVLRPDGCLYIVTPGTSPLLDATLRLLTGESAGDNYGKRRQQLIPALEQAFRIIRIRYFPPLFGRLLPVYRALQLPPTDNLPDAQSSADVSLARS